MSHSFCHLHCHTDYSMLDGSAQIPLLLERAKNTHQMEALAITDHGNLYGVPAFVSEAERVGIKPIIGCEFYLSPTHYTDRSHRIRYHQLLLAKNEIGYRNLLKLSSLSYTKGYYYKPRIDFELLKQHKEGLIATSCCLGAEIPQLMLGNDDANRTKEKRENASITSEGIAKAEARFRAWHELFGKDYYLELQNHGICNAKGEKIQEEINKILIQWSKQYHVPLIATNDVHYVDKEDAAVQDIMLCLQTGKKQSDKERMRFSTNEFYLKSSEEMQAAFPGLSQALENTHALAAKITSFSITHPPVFPHFALPKGYADDAAYMTSLTMHSAQRMHGQVLPEIIKERILYEIEIIKGMGFCSYFLIVQDLVAAARARGVWVGPGRGSVAGSAVAYYLGITEIDPLQYNLLFERFLNNQRISMPDIDLDFDDQGREKVIQYVGEKYGYNQVAQIVTFGRMGAKSAIRDVARVLDFPLVEANQLAKWVPDKPGTTLQKAFQEVPQLAQRKEDKKSTASKVLAYAEKLEGSVRQAGIHAAGIIIAPNELTQHIPVKKENGSDLLITQYDGKYVENFGLLKMDFLGLKTLSILKDAIRIVDEQKKITINLKQLPLDDPSTYQLFQEGNTVGIFQFESAGMQKWLQKLCPTDFEDLIAMNALYRPGPMQFIPNYIDRKQGKESVVYPHPLLGSILKNSYGIMVYQEQVMQTAQIIAGYSLGEADILRRAMGKKKAEIMARQEERFIAGARKKNQLSKEQSQEIFSIMKKFAQYGFPRAHATAYARIAYQTAYLKANHPEAYMSALLQNNQQDISKITFFIQESERLKLKVLGPDINQSAVDFTATGEQKIRFGLSAIKGIGSGIAKEIIEERILNGHFKSVADFYCRMAESKINKTVLENLVHAGAFDGFPNSYHRKQYIVPQTILSSKGKKKEKNYLEQLGKYVKAVAKQKKKSPIIMGGGMLGLGLSLPTNNNHRLPTLPIPIETAAYSDLERLQREKEVIGFYLSGHPLDKWRLPLAHFCSHTSEQLLEKQQKQVSLGGMIERCSSKTSKAGKTYAICHVEDLHGSFSFMLFGERYLKYKHLLTAGQFIYIEGSVQKRYPTAEKNELKIKKIALLEESIEEQAQCLIIHIDLTQFPAHEWCNLTTTLQKNHQGKLPLRFVLYDHKEHPPLKANATKVAVELSISLLQSLESYRPGLRYKIEKK